MSPRTPTKNANNKSNDIDEWVEIVEPRSKKRIYANLATETCADQPPDGAPVSRIEDFSDHWWELYDQKTSQYYYYNPEQQKTAWTRPREDQTCNGTSKRVLIIPVSKIKTFKKISSNTGEKCDAATQTVASGLVSIGTQTISEINLADGLLNRLRIDDGPTANSQSTNSCTHPKDPERPPPIHRQSSDFVGGYLASNVRNQLTRQHTEKNHYPPQIHRKSIASATNTKNASSHQGFNVHGDTAKKDSSNDDAYIGYFGANTSHHIHKPLSIQSPNKSTSLRAGDHKSSTSTFVSSSRPAMHQPARKTQQMSTNNLSHYLVKEARAMGIALISDEELEEDDQETDDEFGDDELHDDLSSNPGLDCEVNTSQDYCEDSSEGWKSFSDHESPNSTANTNRPSSSFNYRDLLNDEKDPASSMSQQLDHRKLVANFKKSRQSSTGGLTDSLGRSHRNDTNHAVQKISAVADGYFNHSADVSDKHLRQLSTLSTLPRLNKETKDKIALSKQDDDSSIFDADYDIVEENCGYYSDSEPKVQLCLPISTTHPSKKGVTPAGIDPAQPLSLHFDRNKSSRGSTFSVESFARENLARHPKKGSLLFNRKVKWSRMISWTKSSIKQPMISSVSSSLTSDSISSFKLIQQFMGDRKVNATKKHRRVLAETHALDDGAKVKGNTSISSNLPDRLRDELAYELVVKGCEKTPLRDEIYIQLARQLTDNPSEESVRWGLVLMSILFNYFSPSRKFSPFLVSFLEAHANQIARDVCLPRLEKRLRQSWMTYCRKPVDGKEISIVRLSITKWPQYCGVFGESLEKIMTLQTCSSYLKTLRLPWILTTLGDKLIATGGAETEGIFRCAADHDLIAQLKLEIDCVDFRKITDAKQVKSLLSNVQDPHVIAGLLKLFFRQLADPVFPFSIYDACIQSGQEGTAACRIFNERLPNLNKDIVAYLIRLLQFLSASERVAITKMDDSNLSMVWAPNLLRVPNQDDLVGAGGSNYGSKWSIANTSGDDHGQNSASSVNNISASQTNIFEQTRQEMQFIRALIVHLDTSFIEDVL